MAAAVLEGASVGPLIQLAVEIDPRYFSTNYVLDLALQIWKFNITFTGWGFHCQIC